MQRHCADVNSPYKRKCWTNSGGPLTNSLLWGTPLGHAFLIKQSCEGVYRPNNLGDLSMQGVRGEWGRGKGGRGFFWINSIEKWGKNAPFFVSRHIFHIVILWCILHNHMYMILHCTLGYENFCNFVVPAGCRWLQNLVLRQVFKKRFVHIWL